MLFSIVIVILVSLAFVFGKLVSDNYNNKIISYTQEMLEEYKYVVRLIEASKGIGYVSPPIKRSPIGQQFMDKLRENGRATQQLNK